MAVEKQNIFLESIFTETIPYRGSGRGGNKYPQIIDFKKHAEYLKGELREAFAQKAVIAKRDKSGTFLVFAGVEDYDLNVGSLENANEGIRLLNVQKDNKAKISATVYIPNGKEGYFLKKIEQYETEKTKSGNNKNKALVDSINEIKLAVLDSFWTSRKQDMPDTQKVRCEIWLYYDMERPNVRGKRFNPSDYNYLNSVDKRFMETCRDLKIIVGEKRLVFPERIVKLVIANRDQLKEIISSFDNVAEIRRAEEPNYFFENQCNIKEQREWCQDLLSRTKYEKTGVSVCLLDAGINKNHPLLKPAISENGVLAVKDSWNTYDNLDFRGHGTNMAGVALFNDLKDALMSKDEIYVKHEIESVKILPPKGSNPSESYGAITKDAISSAEINNPNNNRVICMAITEESNPLDSNHGENIVDGRPSSWSATLDSITSGADEEDVKRLFIVSAGNVTPNELANTGYPEANVLHPVENPAQSWNALTVGAYSNKSISIEDADFKDFVPIAMPYQLSPFSSTSCIWNTRWPIKPEVLFDGGNAATNGKDVSDTADLSLLTTGHKLEQNLFSTINATSAAAAQASWFCAQICAEYPNAWPETVRALVVHSAEWSLEMKKQFLKAEEKKRDRQELLKYCGYGIPNLNRAIECMNNSVNMIIQSELQPYIKKDKSSEIVMNEMHIHTIPWPKELLRGLGNTPIRIKVTLSYFIEPSPGEVGWKDKYRYSSCGLRFEINNKDQDLDAFKKSINLLMREDKNEKGDGKRRSDRWNIGKNARDRGSIISDFIEGYAVDLCECNYVAVYPVSGWWKGKKRLERYNRKVRYSLIVSVSTPEQDINLYTPIVTQIQNKVELPLFVGL